MDRIFIQNLITKHEGRRAAVYDDSVGVPTIGIGWNLQDADSQDICDHYGLTLASLMNGSEVLTNQQIDEVFDYQLSEAISEAMSILPTFNAMPNGVQAAVVDMMFELGLPRFSQFHNMIDALNAGNWKAAGVAAGQSLWARQVPTRAAEDIQLMEAA